MYVDIGASEDGDGVAGFFVESPSGTPLWTYDAPRYNAQAAQSTARRRLGVHVLGPVGAAIAE